MVNICIAIYNVGKNRKIYEIEPMVNGTRENVNEKLKSDDYAILYVGPGKQLEQTTYILGKLSQGRKSMNKKQLIIAWLMAVPICFVWVDWAINYFDPAKNLTAALVSTHIITIVIGGLLMYTLRNKKIK
jgi:hypothetical protein